MVNNRTPELEWKIGDKVFVTDGDERLNGRVVEVKPQKRQVKLRYITNTPKPDEWFSMDSAKLKRSSRTPSPKKSPSKSLKVGQHVLGVWSDGIWYPGMVDSIRSSSSVAVNFYDGLKKTLRISHIKVVTAEEHKQRLDEVLKAAEEMDRSLREATTTVPLGRTRRQDQVARGANTSLNESTTGTPPSTSKLDHPSTSAFTFDQASSSKSVGDSSLTGADFDSEADDAPLSALVSKRPRRTSSRGLNTPKLEAVEVQTPSSDRRTRNRSGSKQVPTPPPDMQTPPSIPKTEQASSLATKRSSSRQQAQRRQVGEVSEVAGNIDSKLRRKSAESKSDSPGPSVPTKSSPATGMSISPGESQLIIVNCTCKKSKQEQGMLQCSLCLTWQHGGCCLGAETAKSVAASQNLNPSATKSIKHQQSLLPGYVCTFCLRPPGAYSDLPERIRSKVLVEGFNPHRFDFLKDHAKDTKSSTNGRASRLRNRNEASSHNCDGEAGLGDGYILNQLVMHTEAVLGLLQNSRQLMDELANCTSQEKEDELTKAVKAIHGYAERLLEKIEKATDAEAERLASQTPNLKPELAEKSFLDILKDVKTLHEMFVRVEALKSAAGNLISSNGPSSSAATTPSKSHQNAAAKSKFAEQAAELSSTSLSQEFIAPASKK